ncbi:tRNA (adenosine(37)-N6)-threonylcarbamoyltransferase complex ATPase subunit type 1 TsaE [Candidatus Kaiserbacteria bacterium]|nr:MAG: tRNA (adenosine(37)-N6)-threonylcarbamoyltransferase complex ATPase subunit type 1 TsaE [Candidatus Kaiserbacteria bacterium]
MPVKKRRKAIHWCGAFAILTIMSAQEYTLEEFENEAKLFLSQLKPNLSTATVLALHGDLGAGKTTFAQILAKELGVSENIVSPTFIIQKRYPLKDQIFKQLIHIDAYRLENLEQLKVLDWDELVSDKDNLIVVEWPKNVDGLFDDATHLYFSYINEDTRSISYGE